MIKTHLSKMDQTWGKPLTEKEMNAIVKRDILNYERHYVLNKDAIVVNKKIKNKTHTYNFGTLEMVYNDDEFGPQSLSIKTYVGGNTRIQQIMSGPDHMIDTAWSDMFFGSVDLEGDVGKVKGNIVDDWDIQKAPMAIFTIATPAPMAPYVEQSAIFSKIDDTREKAEFKIYDPVRIKDMAYSVFSYKADDVWTYAKVKDLLLSDFIVRYSNSAENLDFKRNLNGAIAMLDITLQTSLAKKPHKTDQVRLRATFAQNYLMVQELKGYQHLVTSAFGNQIFAETAFHPKEAYKQDQASR